MNFLETLRIVQFVVLTGYVTWLYLVPEPGGVFDFFWDKLLHVLSWLVLCLSLRLAFPFQKFIWPVLWLFVYSILVEAVQYFMPPRQFSMLDVLANGVGILLALACIRLWRSWPIGQKAGSGG